MNIVFSCTPSTSFMVLKLIKFSCVFIITTMILYLILLAFSHYSLISSSVYIWSFPAVIIAGIIVNAFAYVRYPKKYIVTDNHCIIFEQFPVEKMSLIKINDIHDTEINHGMFTSSINLLSKSKFQAAMIKHETTNRSMLIDGISKKNLTQLVDYIKNRTNNDNQSINVQEISQKSDPEEEKTIMCTIARIKKLYRSLSFIPLCLLCLLSLIPLILCHYKANSGLMNYWFIVLIVSATNGIYHLVRSVYDVFKYERNEIRVYILTNLSCLVGLLCENEEIKIYHRVPYNEVAHITLHQDLIQRFFGLATITLYSKKDNEKTPLTMIGFKLGKAKEFINYIRDLGQPY